ncbi:MAG: HD-GYP domain-containing protein [Lachnospiraceae bacterium]
MKKQKVTKSIKKVPVEYLWEGLVLEENVYNQDGSVMLIPAGQAVTPKLLERLMGFTDDKRFIMTGVRSYETIMKGRMGRLPEDQQELEKQCGYSGLKNQMKYLLGSAKEQGVVEKAQMEAMVADAMDRMENQRLSAIINCIDTPRPVDEGLERHCLNVALLNAMIAKSMGLSKEETEQVILTGTLHDIGKTRIPSEILDAPRKLTDEEFSIIRKHPIYSYQLLGKQVDEAVKKGVLYHHERMDGNGYPEQLSADIPLFARITAISDVYDALVASRSYKDARVPFDVLADLIHSPEEGLDDQILNVFVKEMLRYFREKEVLLSDGDCGWVFFIPPNDISHPVIRLKDNTIRQTDGKWHCVRVLT